MRNIFNNKTLNLLLMVFAFGPASYAQDQVGLIPKPSSLIRKTGDLDVQDLREVQYETLFKNAGEVLKAQFGSKSFKPKNKSNKLAIRFVKKAFKQQETYRLSISKKGIEIEAGNPQAALSAAFTLVQLKLLQPDPTKLPCLELEDQPRFSYRGLHLDVSRNFVPITEIEKLLDMMAIYKLNNFHWHLTDGPGWRLEIKKYPELTSKAAWRSAKDWKSWWFGDLKYSKMGDPGAYGGFYTQDEARNLVAYAKKRGINVIPEIEIPSHSGEVLAVYPQLSCDGKPYTQSEFCLGNDSTYVFLENVLREVLDIFPSRYIHIGGDEANIKPWKKCPKCQKRIKDENLKDEHALQSYAISKIDQFLTRNGRKLIGWDEIMEGGLSPGATVMSWRGESGGIKAAKSGHDVIMTPGSHCYFDQYQGNPTTEPEAIGGFLPIQKVYQYEPCPPSLSQQESRHILGAQANVWTEYIPSTDHLEYMIFPRLLAIAEVLWTEKKSRNWSNFETRLQQHYLLFQRKSINYYRPSQNLDLKLNPDSTTKQNLVSITSEQFHPEIRYTLDGSAVNKLSNLYLSPFKVIDQTTIRAAILQGDQTSGPESKLTAIYNKGIGSTVTYHQPYSQKYAAQKANTLINGEYGSFSYHDGQWQGFEGIDLEVTIALKQQTAIKEITVNFMQLTGPGIYMPEYAECSWSVDGQEFSKPIRENNTVPDTENKLAIKPLIFKLDNTVKFIRIKAKNNKKGFLFADEILIH